MTDREPPAMPFESWADRQIRESRSRGEFDNLPGNVRTTAAIHRGRC
ncbi:hypothetical protein JOF53_007946 [Crossiella equi]|uniref:DnaJ homologue subfamily C member 28 conserved domain-containing protein n=1 Tax=Crossiella equi TaxID=130796 RepID=A0ABS5AR83_9PSEU|nr:DnaJ family domain-containing protein [Crossiella equi]MBP2479074.1 hypothetical protein [Crossiella equi]